MLKNKMKSFYQDAIKSRRGDATNIREPKIRGAQQNVLFADTPEGARVFKFGPQNLVAKNEQISQIYNIHGIPVPRIMAHEYQGVHFEEYPMIVGRTLYQAIGDGIGGDDIRRIYRELLAAFNKMRDVPLLKLDHNNINFVHYVTRENVATVNGRVLSNVFMWLVYLLNLGHHTNIGIYHSGITPKNVIVSDDGHFAGLIDIDEVSICNKNYAFGTMAAKYQQLGFDINELVEHYEQISNDKLNRSQVCAMAGLNNFGRKLLWKSAQRKK